MSLQNYPTASLWRRLAAMAYDGIILIALYIIIGGVLLTLVAKINGMEELPRLSPAMAASLLYSLAFLYYSHSWRRGGQTIGMKSWRVFLVVNDGSSVRLSHCILRSMIGFFSLGLFGLGYIWILFDAKQRTWHDIASMTRVVHKPKGVQ